MWEQIGLTSLPLLTRGTDSITGTPPSHNLKLSLLGVHVHKHLLSLSISLTLFSHSETDTFESDLLPFPSIVVWSLSQPNLMKPDSLLEDSSPNTIALGLGFPTQEFRRPTNIQPKCFPEVYTERGQERKLQEREKREGSHEKGGISQQHSSGGAGPPNSKAVVMWALLTTKSCLTNG